MNNYMVRKTKKKTKKRTKKLKEYDLYNGKHWENYRLGDIFYGQLACWEDKCLSKNNPEFEGSCDYVDFQFGKKWCKSWKSIWADSEDKTKGYVEMIHTRYPNSIASDYVREVGYPDTFRIEDYKVIDKIMRRRKHFKKPDKSTLVIHLRLGDVLSPYYGNVYAYDYDYYKELLTKVLRNKKIKKIDIVTGLHKNVFVKKSNQYLHKIVQLFKEHYPVKVVITKNPDKDFYYMTHSSYFASSGGGFSRLISEYLYTKRKKVYENENI